ncbi:MAG: COX15/CtaA family protein [Hyphomicrobiaceae bacterium]|nr:COX15/CtaA family protein [Hyphomicrobiaceae bacterium]
MSLELQNAVASLGGAPARTSDPLRPVRIWLYVLAAMVLLMVAVGGATRLTDSGLSITEWKPVSGAIPPLSTADWQKEFDLYKAIPEFTEQNSWMQLDDFKFIYWWEWSHRFLGRLIGLVFAVPFVVFLFQRRIPGRLAPWLGLLFVLGGLQGALGWWMVTSGLTQRLDVSQYRLAAHLGAASLLFGALIFVARLVRPEGAVRLKFDGRWMWTLTAFGLLVFLQILMGAFVAGMDAGYGFNTWPLMDGKLIPDNLFVVEPFWRNFFEMHLTAQFTHRMIAYAVLTAALILVALSRLSANSMLKGWVAILFWAVLGQVCLGILTLVLVIPVPLALAHQSLAFMVFGLVFASLADGTAISFGK